MALKDIAKQSIKQAVKRMTTSEMAQDVARMKAIQDLRVKPPSDNVANVRGANFSHPKTIGNQTVNIKDLTGGVRMSDPKEVQRVKALADKIASPEGYISRIIVDHNNNVVEGQHRLEALRQLGVKDVPVFKIEDLADTMPVSKMEEAMREVGGIRSDHVNQLMQHALDDISEGGIEGARQLDYGKFQKHYDAALDAAGKTEAPAYNEISGMVSKMGKEGRSPIVPAPNRWFLQPDKFPNQQKLIERVLQKTGKSREDFPSGAFIDPRTGEVLDSRIMDDLGVVIDPNTNRPMMSSKGESGIEQLDPKTGAFTKSNLVRKGLFKPEGGDPLLNDLSFLATIEKGDVGHKYGLATEYASPTELFNTGTGSNPTLRPRSRGDLFGIGEVVGKASVGRSEPHDVYEKLFVAPKGSDVQGVKLSKANGGAITEGGAVHLAGGGLKGFIKEPLKQAVKRVATSVLPAAEREANLAKMLEGSAVKNQLYHGTGRDIQKFDKSKLRRTAFGEGFHLAESPNLANFYANQFDEAQNVMPVYAAIKNPYELKSMHDWYDIPGANDTEKTNLLKSQGYDGVKYPHGAGDDPTSPSPNVYVAFEPEQIKSATGNRGTYDITDPDITKAEGGAVHLAGGGLRGYIKEPLKQAAKRVIPKTSFEMAQDLARMRASQVGQSVDPKARMLEQGFEKGWYHGGTGDITRFRSDLLGEATNAPSAKKAFFFARDPQNPPAHLTIKTTNPESIAFLNKIGKTDKEINELNKISMKGNGAETASGYANIGGDREYRDAMRKAHDAKKRGDWSEYERYHQIAEDFEINRMQEAQSLVAKYGDVRDSMTDRVNRTFYNIQHPQEHAELLDKKYKELMPFGWYNFYTNQQFNNLKNELTNLVGKEAATPALNEINKFQSIKAQRMALENTQSGANVMPIALSYKNPYVHDFKGGSYRDETYSDLIDKAISGGHDAVIMKNTYDPATSEAKLIDVGAVFSPDQIRSTNAAFDPFRRDAATAAAMGVAAPDLLAKEPEKKADGGVLHLAGKGLKQLVTEPLKQTVKRFIDPKEISSLANEYTQHKANIAFNREKVINQKPVRISEVLAPHEGKYMSTAGQADRLAPEYGGGAGFIGKQLYDPQYKGHGWMVTNQTTGSGMLNPKNYGGELPDIFIPQVGGEKMLYGNPLYFNDVLNTFRHKVAQGDVSSEQIEKINQALRNLKTKNIKTNEMEPVFDPSINILDPYLGDIARTFGKRTKISEILGGKGAGGEKNFDLVNHPALLEKYTDPTLKDVPTGYFGNYMFYPTGTGGTKSGLNTNYLYSIHGEAEPQVFNPAPANLLFPKWEESVEMQKGRPVTSADYRAGSNVYGRPTEQITEENLTNLQKKGFKSGGQVSNDAINVEMWDKALHKAKGGPILGEIDDRTPEEIENASHAAFKLPKARPRMMAEPFQKPKEEPTYQTATAYDPTIRQRLAGVVEKGLKSVSPKPRARALTENLTGTNEQGFGAADLVPYLGSTMQAQETGRDIKKSVNEGDYVGAAIDAIVGGGFAIPGAISTAKALKPTLKSLGPKAGQMAENYLIKSGMMPQVVKREGGNWIGGAEKKIRSLKSKSNISDSTSPEELQSLGYTPEQIQEIRNTQAVNKFIDKNMMNYVKKQMATPSDPVRLGIEARINKAKDILDQKLQNNLQARQQKILEAKAANADPAQIANLERDAFRYQQQIHQEYQDAVQSAGYVPPEGISRFEKLHNEMSRSEAGYPKEGMATTEPSKQWEGLTDYNVQSSPVREVALEKHEIEDYPWINKLNPEDKVHYLRGSGRESLGFNHMLDVLKEKLASGEIKPESLNNMSMDNFVHLTGKYDQELAAKMNAERASAREGLPVHKEYPEGYKWIELNKPGTFAAESEAMGHSVRGYEPPEGHPDWIEGSDVHGNLNYGHGGWEGIKSGRAKVYSLVDSKGAPHATIEVKTKGVLTDNDFGANDARIAEGRGDFGERGYRTTDNQFFETYADAVSHEKAIQKPTPQELKEPPSITQIKGKLNAAPKEEYQPYVQDFVKSGNWSDVGDLSNTGLRDVKFMTNPDTYQKYLERGLKVPKYATEKELDELHNEYLRLAEPSNYKPPAEGMADGGEIERPPIYHAESGVAPFGIRHSGEGVKGRGWFGVLPNQEGGISTEISAESNGHEYPLITPSLTKEQLNLLLSGEKPTPEIYKAAEDWANLRRGKGQSPFASPSDLRFALPKKMGGQINHDAMLVELLNKGKRYG